MNSSTESPCIGICSTVYGDDICRGCKRGYIEVIEWNRYTDQQKQVINQRLEQQMERVIAKFLIIEDAQKLKAQLDRVALRPPLYQNSSCCANALLRPTATKIDTLSACGLRAIP